MPLILDGNNFLHSLPRGRRSRDEVRRQVLEVVRRQALSLTVVFDGPPPEASPEIEHLGRVTIHYSGRKTADDVILALLPEQAADQWVIVTDDRALRETARSKGAQVRSLAEWAAPRKTPQRIVGHEPKLSSREVADWEAYFSQSREDEDRETS
jgi:hypothetical protein